MAEDKIKENQIDIRKGLRTSTVEGCWATVHAAVSIGSIYPLGFIILLGAGNFHYGLMAAIPPLANIIPIFTALVVNRIAERKFLAILTSSIGRFLWVFVPFIPCFIVKETALNIFFLIYGISHMSLAIAGNVWTSWMSDLVPVKLRASYFSKRNMYATAVSLVMVLLAGQFISYFQVDPNSPEANERSVASAPTGDGTSGAPNPSAVVKKGKVDPSKGIAKLFYDYFPFSERIHKNLGGDIFKTTEFLGITFLFVLSGIGAFFSLYFLIRQPHPPRHMSIDHEKFDWREYRTNKPFIKLLTFALIWTFINSFAGPFWGPFLLGKEYLSIRYDYLSYLGIAANLARLVGLWFWGRIIDKYGNKPVMILTIYIGAFHPLYYLFASKEFLLPIWFDHISSGFFWSGLEIAIFNMYLGVSPQRGKDVYFAIYASFTSVIAAALAICSGLLVDYIGSGEVFPMLVPGLTTIELIFFLTAIARFLTLFWLWRMEDVKAHPMTVMVFTVTQSIMREVISLPKRIIVIVEDAADSVRGGDRPD